MSAAMAAPALGAQNITLVAPLLGFGGFTQFVLEPLDESGVLYSLNSADENGPRLFVLDPFPFFTQYKPVLDGSVYEALATTQPRILAIVTAGHDASEHTANLLAPIVLNEYSGAARQVVLEDDSWPLRATFN